MAASEQQVPKWVYVLLGFVGASLLALFIVPVVLESSEDEAQRKVRERFNPAQDRVEQLELALARDAINELGYLLTGDSLYRRRMHRMVDEQYEALAGLHDLAGAMSSRVDLALAGLDESILTWHENRGAALADRSGQDLEAFRPVLAGFSATLTATERLGAAIDHAAAEERAAVRSAETAWRIGLAALAVCALASGGVLTWFGRYLHRLSEERREAMEARDRMLAIVSHDLRAPLQTVLAACETVRERSRGEEPGRMMEIAQSTVANMKRLVDDLLDVKMIERGRLPLQRSAVEVEPLLREIRDATDIYLRDAHEQLAIECPAEPPPIHADPDRLRQVFFNLISNASRASAEGSTITIRVWAEREKVWFSVEDRGEGMDEERVRSLFADAPGDESEVEHGLGLVITRSIVEAHDGEIRVTSTPGVGSAFSFCVPRASGDDAT